MALFTQDYPLASITSFRIGGPARLYAKPAYLEDLRVCCRRASADALPVMIIGNGSNVLISDAGWPGLVINLARHCADIRWNGAVAEVGAGALLHTVVMQSIQRSLAGAQFLAGIPGSMGGALVMNAGAFGQEIGLLVEWVDVMDCADLHLIRKQRHELAFAYRHSSLRDARGIVVRAGLRFQTGDPHDLRKICADVLARRAAKQPLDQPNCGSVFKRPEGYYAGTLMEQCGLKGVSVGKAMISPKHANFIVNTGNATAEDVRALIALAQQKVFETSGILLEPEVIFVGEFQTPLFSPPSP